MQCCLRTPVPGPAGPPGPGAVLLERLESDVVVGVVCGGYRAEADLQDLLVVLERDRRVHDQVEDGVGVLRQAIVSEAVDVEVQRLEEVVQPPPMRQLSHGAPGGTRANLLDKRRSGRRMSLHIGGVHTGGSRPKPLLSPSREGSPRGGVGHLKSWGSSNRLTRVDSRQSIASNATDLDGGGFFRSNSRAGTPSGGGGGGGNPFGGEVFEEEEAMVEVDGVVAGQDLGILRERERQRDSV